MERFGIWIDNEECGAVSGEWFDSIEPGSGEVWSQVAAGGGDDVNRAVQSAAEAFQRSEWRWMEPSARRRLLLAIAARVRDNVEELATVESLDAGKLLKECRLHVQAMSEWFEYFAGMTDKVCGQTIPSDAGVFNYTTYEPYGVVGAIVPGNSPLLLSTWKLAPALAAGNAVVLKPSEYTSASIIALMRLLKDLIPAGIVNVVTGQGYDAGSAVVDHPGIRKVFFTGGPGHGAAVASGTGKRLVPSILELGGKSANIVFADAPREKAMAGVMAGVFAASGQTCMAGSRVLIEASIFDDFVEDLVSRTQKVVVGHPADPAAQVGPIGSQRQLDRVAGLVDRARADGAQVRVGGQRVEVKDYPRGFYYSPTVITGASNSDHICREEIFGPVLTAIPFYADVEALTLANDSDFGLVAGLWTSDLYRAQYFARELNVGTLFLNLYRKVAPQSPFGGRGQSGYGRENGFAVMEEYLQTKSVLMDTERERLQDPFMMRVGSAR